MSIKTFNIAQGLVLEAEQIQSPNCNERPPLSDIDLLVVHSISLPPGEYGERYIDDLFCNQLDCTIHPYFLKLKELQVSAHLLIRRDGSLTQFVNLDSRAWHAGQSVFEGRENCNDYSIGVELEGLEGDVFEEQQYLSLVALAKSLMKLYPKITRQRICGHSDISPGRKQDPGTGFDWDYFFALLGK